MNETPIRIPLSNPDIEESDIAAVVSVLRTTQLSLGPKLAEFEQAVAAYAGVPYGVALSSGTAGLHLGLQALRIGPGDEVILPSFTFLAAANAVLYQQATPVFAEIHPATLNMDPRSVARLVTARTRAILVVHTFGIPAEMDALLRLARERGLWVVEDACEAMGAELSGQRIGSFGDFGVFSFYPNKPITTGEGGVLVTRDAALADMVRALRNQGREDADGWLKHSLLGYNYRIPEMNCALGLAQLGRIESILSRRELVAGFYFEELQNEANLTLPPGRVTGGRVCWFAYIVRLADRFTRGDRDEIVREMNQRGIGCRAYFAPIHQQPLFRQFADPLRSLAITEQVADRTLALPFFNRLSAGEVREVCWNLRELIEKQLAHRAVRPAQDVEKAAFEA